METLFYIAGAVAIASTILMLTRLNAVHALLYLIVSLLAVAVVFWALGAPFVAALEVIIYAGAIMVLFVFVVMMLNLGPPAIEQERGLLAPGMWIGPCLLALVLAFEVAYIVLLGAPPARPVPVGPKQVGMALFGPYLIGVELASMLLLGALVGAFHLGARLKEREEKGGVYATGESRIAAGRDLVRAGADRSPGAP